jgi:hypothetical protein
MESERKARRISSGEAVRETPRIECGDDVMAATGRAGGGIMLALGSTDNSRIVESTWLIV